MRKPLYYQKFYAKVYESDKASRFFSMYPIWQLLSGFQKGTINNSLLKEIDENDKVLFFGISFDNTIDLVCQKAKSVSVMDFSQNQVQMAKEKYQPIYPEIKFMCKDATTPTREKFDVVICNNLLHEVPNATKAKIINNALRSTKNTGETVFVDYHKPSKYFVLRYFIKIFNRLYQPFAEKMWDKSIETYVKDKHKYSWRKKTFVMGCFQKVTARKKVDYI